MSDLRSIAVAALLGVVTLGAGACASDDAAPVVAGPQVEIQTSPITYPGIANVCFGLEVFNGQPGVGVDTVWSKQHLCSDTFGSGTGGAISYVGPCDAGVDGDNYVALTLESITVDGGQTLDDQTGGGVGFDGADFQNPCTSTDRCYLHFKCEANKDTRVEFNLTVMRDADQGFFDIGVAFEDVFCAAKVDTCTAPGTPIALLYGDDVNDAVGVDRTAVAAIACTAGPDTIDHDFATNLLFTTRTVSCTDAGGNGVTFALDAVDQDAGQLSATADSGDFTLQYANYFGAEELVCGGYLTLNDDEELLFECGGPALCRIAGAGIDNAWAGYGFAEDDQAGQGAQGSQGSARSGAGRGSSLGYGGAYIYVSDAATLHSGPAYRSGSSLTYYDGNGDPFTPTLVDGKVPGWEPVITETSCNKAYYNTAIDVENLAGQGLADCALSFEATAIASDSTLDFDTATGTFTQPGGLYGAVQVPAVPLTGPAGSGGAVGAVCDANPLDGTDLADQPSLVHTHYIGTLVDDNPAFCFHSDDGAPLEKLAGCGEIVVPPDCGEGYVRDPQSGQCVPASDCPIGCSACQAWAATVSCVEVDGDVVCTIDGAPASTTIFVGPSSLQGSAASGATDPSGHLVLPVPGGDTESPYAYYFGDDGHGNTVVRYLYTGRLECTECIGNRHLDNAGNCVGLGAGG